MNSISPVSISRFIRFYRLGGLEAEGRTHDRFARMRDEKNDSLLFYQFIEPVTF